MTYLKMVLTATATVFVVGAATTSANAQAQNCGPREAVVSTLAEKYGETRQSMGMGSNNTLIEMFASEETGSWTIVVTQANGLTCLVASGQEFVRLNEVLPPKGDEL